MANGSRAKVMTDMSIRLTHLNMGVLSVSRAVVSRCFAVVLVIRLGRTGGSIGRIGRTVGGIRRRRNLIVHLRTRSAFRTVRQV